MRKLRPFFAAFASFDPRPYLNVTGWHTFHRRPSKPRSEFPDLPAFVADGGPEDEIVVAGDDGCSVDAVAAVAVAAPAAVAVGPVGCCSSCWFLPYQRPRPRPHPSRSMQCSSSAMTLTCAWWPPLWPGGRSRLCRESKMVEEVTSGKTRIMMMMMMPQRWLQQVGDDLEKFYKSVCTI